jgi:hypothetical protein
VSRHRRRASYTVSPKGLVYWIPELRRWVEWEEFDNLCDAGTIHTFSTFRFAWTRKAAFRKAHGCPAEEVIVAVRFYDKRNRNKDGTVKIERVWTIQNY